MMDYDKGKTKQVNINKLKKIIIRRDNDAAMEVAKTNIQREREREMNWTKILLNELKMLTQQVLTQQVNNLLGLAFSLMSTIVTN